MDLTHFDSEACAVRRRKLAAAMQGTPALLFAGTPVSRNYPAATYPFRASSHFLYLAGLPLREAALLVEGEGSTIFLPQPGPDEALWHGPTPGFAELEAWTGCALRPLSHLGGALGGRVVAALPPPDRATRALATALLGRELAGDALEEPDARLADAMIGLRLVHDAAALGGLRRAADATVAAHLAGLGATRPGITEAEVRAAMEAELTRRGMTTSYGSIVTVHGEVLHAESHHRTLAEGDLLLADVGAETQDGWAGDVTRTWPVNGRFSTTQRELYQVVLEAQRAAIGAVVPGARYRDVHLVASRAIAAGLVSLGILRGDPAQLVADGVHALFFPHGIGHLLGLDVHDLEDLGDRAGYAPGRERSKAFGLGYLRLDRDLEPGMAVTIEPGCYRVPAILQHPRLRALGEGRVDWAALERFGDVRGIRIEDDVLVTATGSEVLTARLPKEAAEVEARVGATA